MFDRSFGRVIRNLVTGCTTVRVAVIGAKECGKTVFLTALANHLQHPVQSANPQDGGLDLHGWSILPAEDEDEPHPTIPAFEYGAARDRLCHGEWPDNTRGVSLLRRRFRLEDRKGRRRTVLLEMLDLPGERVADLSMKGRDFREWSAWMERRFGGETGVSRHYLDYLRSIESTDDVGTVLSRYKDCVSSQYADGIMTITPSVLKLGADGVFRGGVPAADFRRNIEPCPVGVDADSQFAPLPGAFFEEEAHRGLVRRFAAAYERYRAKVVEPIAKWVSDANKVIYLVDVLSLLRRGPEAYNSEREFAVQALRLFRRTSHDFILADFFLDFLGAFVRTRADGVYVVATKSDTVVGDVNRNHMKNLAETMMGNTLAKLNFPRGQVEVLTCASVLTSDEFGDEKALSARVESAAQDAEGRPVVEEKKYRVSDVPMDWPDGDKWLACAAEFDFRPTFPRFDRRTDKPPRHLGLDALVRRLLSL